MGSIDKKGQKFKDRGTLVEIKLENFITYSNAVIQPGRNLNLIIGPNGTGKSTIMTALALGFGGTPKLIGKPEMAVSQTIRAGCTSARIDLTIRDTPTKNITLSRTIDSNNKSTWHIDKNQVTAIKFKEIVKQFNIQVDNLTQFLPQENIKGFSELTPQGLLHSTEKSVSDISLEEYHTTLVENRKLEKNLEEDMIRKSNRLETAEQRFATLSQEVSQFQERKNLKKKLAHLKQKKAWMRYDRARQDYLEAKKRRDDAAANMKALDDQLAPIDNFIRSLEVEVTTLDRKLEQSNQKIIDFNQQYTKLLDDMEDLNDMIKSEDRKCQTEIENENQRDKKIQTQQQMSEKLENDMLAFEEEYGSEETIKQHLAQLNPKMDKCRTAITTLTEQQINLKTSADQLAYQVTNLRREQQMLKDVDSKRMEILRSRSKDAHEAVLWLRENQHIFRHKVWEPMMLHIQVQEDTYAKYFENVISHNDLIAFVCEDKDDMTRLLHELRERRNLKINVVHSDPERPVRMNPRTPLEQIKPFGFTHYLIELVEAPEPILKYIVNMYNINNIPIGNSTVDTTFERLPPQFSRFFSVNKSYSVATSKYSGQKSTSIREVGKTATLSVILDTNRINSLEQQIEECNKKKEGILQHMDVIQEKLVREKQEVDKMREEKQNYTTHQNRIQALTSKIRMAEHKLRDLQAERRDIAEIKARRDAAIKKLVLKQLKLFKDLKDSTETCYQTVKASESIELQFQIKNDNITIKRMESQDIRDKLKQAEEIFEDLDKESTKLSKKAKELQDVAKEMTGGFTPHNREEFRVYNAAFNRLPETLDEIEEMIGETNTKIYVSKNNPDMENVIREHDQVRIQIGKLKEEISAQQVTLDASKKQSAEIKDKWLPPLQSLVHKISSNFSNYLAQLDCAGQVDLIHGDNPDDFDSYGLKILVKFRSDEPLQEFNKNRQSGGETSLTTALYMIALQEISQVPFRCVDEINQGMDATNDRKVFERIMDITGKTGSSQYFLLTPKLLPKLPYNESVTVLCVLNGPNVVPTSQWNIDNYCRKLEARRRHAELDASR